MITIKDVSLRLGRKDLFENVELTLYAQEKIGLIGRNGCGKTSLFSLILNELSPCQGEILKPKALSIATLKQETPALTQSALDYVLDGDHEFRRLEKAINDNHDIKKSHLLQESFEAIEGYRVNSKACQLLHGLGFTEPEFSKPVKSFSGGWRMRLNLAQCLMARADLLLLDEPTNHLDLNTLIWLERFLKKSDSTLVLISHDKQFLNNICTAIVHIENKTLNRYQGNYDAFERTRAEQLELQQKTYEKQQKHIQHMMSFVTRFKAKSSKAKQAQSRLKAIDKIELVARAHIDSPFYFEFKPAQKCSSPMLSLTDASIGYPQKNILNKVNFSLAFGERIALLGPNGAGKSTLLKCLAHHLTPTNGKFYQAPHHLKVAYYAQHQLEQLHIDESPLTHLQRLQPKATEQVLRDYLGGFDFAGDTTSTAINHFSGGEKARLVLALLVFQAPNLLLLDEPSNHLDIEMRQALELALQAYQGSLVIISHDRQLLSTTVDSYYLVNDGKVLPYEGDLDDYEKYLFKPETAQKTTSKPKQARKVNKQKLNRLKSIESELEKLAKEKLNIELKLSDASLYDNKQLLDKTLAAQNDCQQQVDDLESEWFNLKEALEG